jgi:glycerol uptake facilitator-like aquaporin
MQESAHQASGSSGGPSPELVAWRRFIVETVVCIVLVAVVTKIGLVAYDKPFTALTIGAIVAAIRSMIWCRS